MPRKGGKRVRFHLHHSLCRGRPALIRRRSMRTWSSHLNVSTHLTHSDIAFVIKRGRIGMYTKELLNDTRDLLYPYTALKLKESKKNSIKDFISVAGQFGVSHMLIFSQTDKSCYLRLLKNPKGPTITFKIDEYSLAKDVVKF